MVLQTSYSVSERLVGQSKVYRKYSEKQKGEFHWQCLIYKNENSKNYFLSIKTKFVQNNKEITSQEAKYRDVVFDSLDEVSNALKRKMYQKKQSGYKQLIKTNENCYIK